MMDAISELKNSIARLEDPTAVHYTSPASKAEMLATLRGALAKLEADAAQEVAQPELTREYLIDLCERAVVNVEQWSNRDTPRSQEKVGMAWALLKAGCEWHAASSPESDQNTIWIEITYPSFNSFEYDRNDPQYFERELFYLPTEARLAKNEGWDWY